jgi:hypothetical protein
MSKEIIAVYTEHHTNVETEQSVTDRRIYIRNKVTKKSVSKITTDHKKTHGDNYRKSCNLYQM